MAVGEIVLEELVCDRDTLFILAGQYSPRDRYLFSSFEGILEQFATVYTEGFEENKFVFVF